MIKVYKNWKLYKKFEHSVLTNMHDVEFILWYLVEHEKITTVKIPKYCEEPIQYTLRKNWFTLQSY